MKKNVWLVILVIWFPAVLAAHPDSVSNDYLIEEVVVSATKTQVNRNNVPMTISVVNRQQIENSSESALLPVLSQQVPGMFVSERGVTGFGVASGAAGGISMRGIGGSPNTQMLVLIDGHPQFMGLMGHPLPDAYVASDAERVEVIRGPASILYGTNAMGGVVNIITRKQKHEGFNLGARAMGGSFSTQKYMLNSGFKKNKLSTMVSVNHDQTQGHRSNSAFHITKGFGNVSYQLSKHLKAVGNISVAKYMAENPGLDTAPLLDAKANILRGMASVGIENHYGKLNGALSAFYNWGQHQVHDGHVEAKPAKDFYFRSDDHNYGLMLYQSYQAFKGNTVTAGVDYKLYGGHAWNHYIDQRPDAQMVDTAIYEVAGYALMQQNLLADKLSLTAGLRLEHNKAFGQEWVPQVGFAYRPAAGLTFKGSASKGFRSPTIREMFMWGPANPDLRPERMMNYELSVSQNLFDHTVRWELTGFVSDGEDLIQVVMIEGKPRNMNAGQFTNKGIEVALDWRVAKSLQLHTHYSYLGMSTPVLNAPRQQAFVSASYHYKQWQASASYHYIEGLYLQTGPSPMTASYGLANARVAYSPLSWLSLFVKGENLTDRHYEVMAYFPMPGITLFGGVSINLHQH